MAIVNVTPEQWVPADYRPTAILSCPAAEITHRTGVTFASDIEEGLGQILIAGVRLPSNRCAIFIQYLQAPQPYHGFTNIELPYEPAPTPATADTIDEILVELGFVPGDLNWSVSGLTFSPHAIWRQDDNGHKFLVSVHSSKSEATQHIRPFELLTHKQFYWLETVPRGAA